MIPACDAGPAADLPAAVEEGRSAIYAEDLRRFEQLAEAVERGLPCLSGPVVAEDWARWLVTWAVAEAAEGGAWTSPLEAALRTWPEVPRDLGLPMVRSWTPEPPSGATAPLPGPGRWWLDGRELQALPSDLGPLHLLQRELDGAWTTALIRDRAVPAAWLPAAPETADRRREPGRSGSDATGSWAAAGAAAGVGWRAQEVASSSGLPAGSELGPAVGGVALGRVGGSVSVAWDAAAAALPGRAPDLEAGAHLGLGAGRWSVGLGGGLVTAELREAAGPSLRLLPLPQAAATWVPASWLRMGVVAGGSAAALHARATAAVAPGRLGGLVRVGWTRAFFVEEGGDLTLRHDALGAELGAAWVFGARR